MTQSEYECFCEWVLRWFPVENCPDGVMDMILVWAAVVALTFVWEYFLKPEFEEEENDY